MRNFKLPPALDSFSLTRMSAIEYRLLGTLDKIYPSTTAPLGDLIRVSFKFMSMGVT